MTDFQLPDPTIHLGGSPKGKRMDVWFVPHLNGDDVLIITRWESGTVESAWGSASSIRFHRDGGLVDVDGAMPEVVLAIAARRLGEADQWATLST